MAPKKKKCSYLECDSRGPLRHMFTFPVSNPDRCRQWIIRSGNEALVHCSPKVLINRYLCDKHFSQNRFTSLRRNRLIPTALPFDAFDEQHFENGIDAPVGLSDPLSLPKQTEESNFFDASNEKHFENSIDVLRSPSSFAPKEKRCSYLECDSVGPPRHMFNFPVTNPDMCRQWIIRSGNEDFLHSSPKVLINRYLCDKHFSQNRFTSIKKNRLIPTALPFDAFDEQHFENGIDAPLDLSDPLSLPKQTEEGNFFDASDEEHFENSIDALRSPSNLLLPTYLCTSESRTSKQTEGGILFNASNEQHFENGIDAPRSPSTLLPPTYLCTSDLRSSKQTEGGIFLDASDEQHFENGIDAPQSPSFSLPPECTSNLLSLPNMTGQHLPFKEEKEEDRRMEDVIACAICLSTDVSALQNMRSKLCLYYYLITGLQLDSEKGMPHHLCYECAAHLSRCNKFRDKCHRSYRIMNEIIFKSKTKLSQENITSINREDNRLSSHLRSTKLLAITYSGPLDNDGDVKDSVSSFPEDDFGSQIEFNDIIQIKIEDIKSEGVDEQSAENRHDIDNSILESLSGSDKEDMTVWVESDQLEDKQETIAQISKAKEDENTRNSTLHENIGMVKKECVNKLKTYSKVKTTEEKKPTGDAQCDVCRKNFRLQQRLREHQLQHSNIYVCKLCTFTSHIHREIFVHYISKHRGVKIKCQHCDVTLPTSSGYLRHLHNKHPPTHACGLCGMTLVSELYLGLHKSLIHPNALKNPASVVSYGRFCGACNVNFVTEQAYSRHLRTSANHFSRSYKDDYVYYEAIKINDIYRLRDNSTSLKKAVKKRRVRGPIECEQCGLKVANFSEYNIHFQKKHGHKNRTLYSLQRTALCEECGQLCTSLHLLKDHQAAVHSGNYRHQCSVCEKKFKTSTSLCTHMYKHSTMRYQCDYCQKCFIKKDSLIGHIERHTQFRGHKKWKRCKVCGKMITKEYLFYHMKTHEERQRYLCEHCDIFLLSKSSLERHIKSYAHLQNHQKVDDARNLRRCKVCRKKFTKMYLSIHMKKHRYECHHCQIKFTLKGNLKRHMEIHMNLQVPCNYCQKIFTCRNNLRTHIRGMHWGETKI